MSHKSRIKCLALFLLTSSLSLAEAAPLLPHETTSVKGDILAHHVRLTGTGGEKPLRQITQGIAQQCAELGKPIKDFNEHTPLQRVLKLLIWGYASATNS